MGYVYVIYVNRDGYIYLLVNLTCEQSIIAKQICYTLTEFSALMLIWLIITFTMINTGNWQVFLV